MARFSLQRSVKLLLLIGLISSVGFIGSMFMTQKVFVVNVEEAPGPGEEPIHEEDDVRFHEAMDATVEEREEILEEKEEVDYGIFSGPLNTTERYHHEARGTGWTFDKDGRHEYISVDLPSSMVHSFSPYVEREAARRFIDPPHSNTYVANSPAVMWFKGELVLVSRIWLVREKYEPKEDWPANHFSDNYFYTQRFDRNLRPSNNGSIMGIPTPKQWWVGDGPIEPRLCKVKDHLFVTFNTAMAIKHKHFIDFTMMWDYVQNVPIMPDIKGGSPMLNASDSKQVLRDKHWMALIQEEELYFVHNLDPLRIMHCTLAGYCEFVHSEKDASGFVFDHHINHLRGGTPFELYEWPYYISVAHSTMYKSSNHHRYYAAHIVVLCVAPYRVVYVGDKLEIHPDIYKEAPMVRPRWIDDGFIFPVGILLESDDWMTIGVHVNDFSSVLIRFKGIRALMKAVIASDKKKYQHTKHNPRTVDDTVYGPPIGYLHKHIHDKQQNITNIKLEN